MPRPRCFNGSPGLSIGEEGDNDNNAVLFHSPPVDEVQRWKEFRRRQRTQPAATTDEEEVTDDNDVGYYPGAGVVPSSLVHNETYAPRSEISASNDSKARTEIMANTARHAVDLSRKEAYKLLEGHAGNDNNNQTASSSLSAEKAKRVMQYAATPSPRVTHTKKNIIPTTTTLASENVKKGKKIEEDADEEKNYDDTIISPKLSEVENFMVQLRRVRNESKTTTPPKSVGDVQNTKVAIIATITNTTTTSTTTTTTAAGNPPEDEDDECTILSKRRKEQSRQRKSEDFQRRKNEFDMRIRDMKKDAAVVDVADDELIVADGGIKKTKKKWVPNLNVTIDLDDSTLDNDDEEEEEEEEKDEIRTKAVVDVGVGARWSGGSAHHFLPTPSSLKKTETKERKLNIALNEDDFSFKPSSIVNVNTTTTTSTSNKHGGGGLSMKSIAISPIVTGAATGVVGGGVGHHTTMTSSGRFNFARCSSLSNEKASSRGMTILMTMVNAANCTTQMGVLSPSSDLEDNDIIFAPFTATTTLPIHFESTPKNNISESTNGGPVTTSESSFPSSTSPDISEGDKGGGGFGSSTTSNNAFRGLRVRSDKSIITTTSSKYVELGQKNDSQDPPLDDEEDESTNNDDGSNSLLGVTVVGSKKKRKKRKTKSPLFETVEEHDSLSSTLDNNANSENLASTDECDGKPTNGCIVRKQLDPDGFDWKELAKWTDVELTSKVSTVAAQERKDQTLLGLSVDTIPEESDNEEFATVMDRVKTCLTPRMPNDTSIFTPKSVQSDIPRYGGGKKLSSIHELKSRFDSLGVVQNQSTKRVRSEEKSRFEFSSSTGSSESIKDSWTRSTASLASATDAEVVRPIPDEQDFYYTLSNSSETLSVKELRSKWETRNKATRPMVVGDACLNNREIQATSTSESSVNDDTVGDETVDTKKVLRFVKSLEQKGSFDSIKSLDNENGGIEHKDTSNSSKENHYDKETVDAITECITTYRGMPPKMRKEVVLVRTNAQAHEQLLKNKTEMKEDNNCAASNSNALSSNGNHAISSAAVPSNAEIVTASVKDRVAIFSTAKAALMRRRSSPSNVLPPQEANSDIPSIPLQQQSKISAIRGPSRVPLPAYQQVATPPRTIAMNQTSNSPSPLQVTNTNYSPNLQGPTNQRASSNFRQEFSRLPCSRQSPGRYSSHADRPLRHVSTRNEEINRPVPVDTRYDSSPAQEFDYDDEDGITLSPTFSEVSGLTAPTCIGTINSHTSTHPDLFDKSHGNKNSYHETMSPIARHRQQQEKLALITGHTKLSTHPYIKRLGAKLHTMPVENQISNNNIILEEVATPKARGRPSDGQLQISPSRREQLISRVRASPRNLIPKSNPPITEERSLTTFKTSIKKERNVIVEDNAKTFIRQKNGKGRVSESIKLVNRRI